jgi:hypothetical protein
MRRLQDEIATLSQGAHEELFKLVQKHDIPYTRNNNGVFFVLDGGGQEERQGVFVNEVSDFVRYCCDNKAELDAYDRGIQSRKLMYVHPRPAAGSADTPQCSSGDASLGGGSCPAWLARLLEGVDEQFQEKLKEYLDSGGIARALIVPLDKLRLSAGVKSGAITAADYNAQVLYEV